MSKVYQKGKNDCMRAAIASILNLKLKQVPKFHKKKNFWKSIKKFLESKGLYIKSIWVEKICAIRGYLSNSPRGYHLTIIQNVNNPNFAHAIVCRNGKIVHDPADKREIHKYYSYIARHIILVQLNPGDRNEW